MSGGILREIGSNRVRDGDTGAPRGPQMGPGTLAR
jgi:hypothetical protein